ncbi:MAG: serine protease, partial [Pirellulaceae bacterium]
SSLIMLKYEERLRRLRRIRLLFTFGVLIVTAVVATIVYFKVAADSQADVADQTQTAENKQDLKENLEPKNVAAKDSQAKKASPVKPREPEVVRSHDLAKFAYHTPREAEDLWARVFPSILELKISRGGTESSVAGVLVDSRGWVVTSYSGIRDADQILCRVAPSQMTFNFNATAVTDTSKGILAFDADVDLAIIQINRKLVDVITPITIAKQPPVVGVRTFMAAPPSLSKFAWVSESQIAFESFSNSITENLKTTIEAAGLKPDRSWQVHDTVAPAVPGSPIFTIKNALIGVVTKGSTKSKAIVASGDEISNLIKQVGDEPIIPATVQDNFLAPPNMPQLPVASDYYTQSRQLNDTALACLPFDWIPTRNAELDLLINFFRTLQATGDVIRLREQRIKLDDEIELTKQINFWELESSVLLDDPELTQIKAIHALSGLDQLTKLPAKPCLAYVEVTHAATLGQSKHYAKVLETNLYLGFDAEPEKYVMGSGSRWLLVVESIEPAATSVDFGAKKINSRGAKISAAFELSTR